MAETGVLTWVLNAAAATGNWLFANRADLIGIGGLLLTMAAYREARAAKQAAHRAGQIIKRRTANIELTELLQVLESLDPHRIDFESARNLLNRIHGKVLRLTEPYQADPQLRPYCDALKAALEQAEQALVGVWPDPGSEFPVGNMVYQAMHGRFAAIRVELARLLGRFDSDSIEVRP